MSRDYEVMIQSEYALSGTITIPDEKKDNFPAILIISGSGKGDRDGNLKNMKMNIYKELADFFASQGFITLRYDKRGVNKSDGSFTAAGISDFIDDATAGLQLLKYHPEVDSDAVLILGHSEGALIAPAVHKQEPAAGLILLAGAAGSTKDLSSLQTEAAFAEMNRAKGVKGWLYRKLKVTNKARKQNEKIFKKAAGSNKDFFRVKGVKINAKWLRETLSFNTADYLKEVQCPVLAITGEKDVQVPPEHVKRILELVKGEAEGHIIPDMNHILRKYKGQHTMLGLIKEYKAQLNQPIDQDLLDKLSEWLVPFKK